MLLARDPAAHVTLDTLGSVTVLLSVLREAGAQEQAAALAEWLPGAGMFDLFRDQDQVRRMWEAHARNPTAMVGMPLPLRMVELIREREGRQDQFWFGREHDGSPARPWDWGDLY